MLVELEAILARVSVRSLDIMAPARLVVRVVPLLVELFLTVTDPKPPKLLAAPHPFILDRPTMIIRVPLVQVPATSVVPPFLLATATLPYR